MKTMIRFLLLCLSLTLTSCGFFTEIDMGFPKTVTFPKEGGEQTVTSNEIYYLKSFQIIDENLNGSHSRVDENLNTKASNQWLTVEGNWNSHELKITAEPNTSGKKRKSKIEIYQRYDYCVIEVEQK